MNRQNTIKTLVAAMLLVLSAPMVDRVAAGPSQIETLDDSYREIHGVWRMCHDVAYLAILLQKISARWVGDTLNVHLTGAAKGGREAVCD